MSMDAIRGNQILSTKLEEATTYGNPRGVVGKIGQAMKLDGRREYIDGGDQVNELCLNVIKG